LINLGFLKYPPLEKIIKIAGSDDPGTQHAAFKYLSDKFEAIYENDYEFSKFEDFSFIPAVKDDGEECVGTHKNVRSVTILWNFRS